MKSRKKLVAVLSICAFIGVGLLLVVMYGPVLDDDEFDAAVERAQQSDFTSIEETVNYPFSPITRAEATQMYVSLAQQTGLMPQSGSCVFSDIDDLSEELKESIRLACQYGFFGGSNGTFEPDALMTKGMALVALSRGIWPGREFEQVKEYRVPYFEVAYEEGLTKREPGPYVNGPVTRYELLLLLRRGYQLREARFFDK